MTPEQRKTTDQKLYTRSTEAVDQASAPDPTDLDWMDAETQAFLPSGPRVQLHEDIEGERTNEGWQFYEDCEDVLGVSVHASMTLEEAQQLAAAFWHFYQRGKSMGIVRGRNEEQRKYSEVFSNIFKPIADAIRNASETE